MRRGRRAVAALTTTVVLGGCPAYKTLYHAPVDGRARSVWDASGQMVVEPAGLVLTAECGAALRALTGHAEMPLANGVVELPAPAAPVPPTAAVAWQPIYYGDAVVVGPLGPAFPSPPVYFWTPGLYWQDATYAGYYGSIGRAQFARALSVPVPSHGGSAAGGGGGGGGGGDRGAVVAAVLVAITLPIVDIAVASASPVSRSRAATVTDLVAAWNDLARTPGSPCAMPGGAVAMPAEVTSAPLTSGSP